MLLWITFAAITALVLATVLWPLLRGNEPTMAEASHDIAIYRDQLAEIDADLSRGLIGEAEAEAAKAEISRRLLARAGSEEGAELTVRPRSGLAVASAITAAAAIPVLTLGFYLTYGAPGMPDQPLATRLQQPNDDQDIAVLVGKVEARLREHPEDGRGWDVIAPVYFRMQRYQDAANAYATALRLEGESVRRLTGYGEALVLANNGIVGEKARVAFEKALETDKTIPKVRFWLGIAAEQDGRYERALETWRGMLADAPADAPWRGMVTERIAIAQAKLGRGDAPASTPEAASGPNREQVAAAEQMSPEDRAAMINQMVEGLAQRLAKDGSDLQGWLRLVRAYSVLGERGKAQEALKSARANFEGNQTALGQLAALQESLGL